jgi:LEA14-like dessication related protein
MKYLITVKNKHTAIKIASLLAEITGNKVQVASGQRSHAHIAIETKEPLHIDEITDKKAHAQYMKNHPQVISVNVKCPRA